MMDSDNFSRPQWQWPTGMDPPETRRKREPPPLSSTDAQPTEDHASASQGPNPEPQPRPRRRFYKPRTCRICLEVVPPTTEIDESLTAGLFASTARVRFESEDPELGRLVSPCMCKGSQKYVHEGCLEAWRQASPLSDRNFWCCPTCKFEYRLSRLSLGRWLSSKLLRVIMTVSIMFITVFFLGFVADPIINLWIDPWGSITDTIADVINDVEATPPFPEDDEPESWWFHFLKGFLSLGLLGFIKTFFAMNPFTWFNLRTGVGAARRRGRGRDRIESVNLALVIIGVLTFLGATWKLVSHLSAKALEKASNRVVDVQGDDPDDFEEAEPVADESKKDR